MNILKQSTAVDVMLGPFVDDTDGKTTEEALTLSQADLQLVKNGAAAAQKNDATAGTHRYGGHYMIDLDATDTNTVGTLRLMCKESGALPVFSDFQVVEEAVYDAMFAASAALPVTLAAGAITDASLAGNMEIVFETDFATNYNTTRNAWSTNLQDTVGTGNLTVDVIAISGDTTAANNAELAFDGTGYGFTNCTVPTVTTLTGHTAQTGDTFALANGLTGFAAIDTVVDGIQTDLSNGTDGLGALKTLIDALNDLSAADVNAEMVDVITVDAISEIAQGVPSATPNLADAVMLLYMALRNKLDVATSGTDTMEVHNSAGTRICQKLLTDDGSDYSEAKMTSGA